MIAIEPSREPRIAPVVDMPEDVKDVVETGWQHDGNPLNLTLTLARNPRLLRRFSVFAGLFLMRSELPPREQELLALRSAVRSGSEYLFGHHVHAARQAGMSANEIAETTQLAEQSDDRDRLLTTVVDEMFTNGCVTDQTWDAIAEVLEPSQALEAVMAPGFYRMVANFVQTIGVAAEPDLPGWPETNQSRSTHQEP